MRMVLCGGLLLTTAGAMFLAGCDTWHGLGKDIGKAGDSMAGDGKYVMTVRATPDKVTIAARKAVEQLKMTDVESSGDRSEGKVTARTASKDTVKVEIEQSGETHSKVTVYTHGDDADTVGKQVQDQIRRNLP